MQAPSLHRTDALPAADLAAPGTWPSCAVKPRVPSSIAAPADGEGSLAGRGSGLAGTRIHRTGTFGKAKQDRQDDQRGRAVACA